MKQHFSRACHLVIRQNLGNKGIFLQQKTQTDTKKIMGSMTHSSSQSLFHEIFSCRFVLFVVQKKFLGYQDVLRHLLQEFDFIQFDFVFGKFQAEFYRLEGLAKIVGQQIFSRVCFYRFQGKPFS